MEKRKCSEIVPGTWTAFGGRANTKRSRPPIKATMTQQEHGICVWTDETGKSLLRTRTGVEVWVGLLSELG
ncbi:hypothetical protein [Kitasatospora sp. NPDC098663]|uniref:hypothetical protein n=1 Tax=Kitasatospora sp. NPDC098663 TaxID=3364096 RepID=UPI0037F5D08C